MECPDCGQAVLVQDGSITAHLNPETLQPCTPKKTAAPKHATKAAPKSSKP